METSRIFVKGLPPSITEAEFRKHFSAKDREITDVKLIPQRRIGYVGYKSPDVASKAARYFDRSFIRMSRISVSPARPISDLAPPKGNKHHDLEKKPAAKGEPPLKKRKREDAAPSDARLQEYLQVMKPGGAAVEHIVDGIHETPTQALPEAESDDEYEKIPSKREKKPKLAPTPAQGDTSLPRARPETKGADDGAPRQSPDPEAQVDQEEQSGNADPVATEATDDDWLRSRTNRLLDLVDADDLPADPASQKEPTEVSTEAPQDDVGSDDDHDTTMQEPEADPEETTETAKGEDQIETIRRTCRLFIRNLSYNTTEDDLRDALEQFGRLVELHLPVTAGGSKKGFALALFAEPDHAVNAFQAMDRKTFQGRILHLLPAQAKRDQDLDEFAISQLPLKKQNLIRKRAEAASNTFNWNALFMNQDAVNSSVADRLGVSKAEMLDPTSADAAVRQAIAETSVIQETKAYFATNGVDLDAFRSHKRGDTAILVKNFPYGTTLDELRKLFEESGQVLRVLMPPSGTIAIVQFAQANHAKAAFGKLAYRRIRDSVLYLEKAPKGVFTNEVPSQATPSDRVGGQQKLSAGDLLAGDEAGDIETTSLFVRNLNFATSTTTLAGAFGSLDGFVSARVKTKMDPKKPGQTLSMGFGFVEFRTKEQAQAALKLMDGSTLEDHVLAVKASHKGHDAAEERRREDKAKKAAGQRTKIVIKNLPFQATKKDIRTLFGSYGQLRSVRVPKKADFTSRGFAFADFITSREAENALNALKDTHLLGRKLVLDFAEAEAVDAEEEIEKMQRKVGRQVNKVALQKLTGGGRSKVNIGNEGEEEG